MSGANEVSAVIGEQPDPIPNDRPALWDLVLKDLEGPDKLWDGVKADMKARDAEGRKKYKTPLQAFNGRDALVDAYQEVLDGIVYTKQGMVEDDYLNMRLQDAYEHLLGLALTFKLILDVRKETRA